MTLDGSMKPYLALSAAGHGGLALLVAMLGSGPATSGKVYRIDFIGPTSGIINRDTGGGKTAAPAVQAPPAAASPAKRPPPQTDPDAFGRGKKIGRASCRERV